MSQIYNETLSFLRTMEKNREKPPYIFSICLPQIYPPMGRLGKNPSRLRKAAEDSMAAVLLALQ
jgi:hypothetical protein